MLNRSEKPKALISVWDKSGLVELTQALVKAGYEILSSSGTAAYLRENGFQVTEVEEITGLPSILGGRVKTLHPAIMGGILARRDNTQDEEERGKHSIPLIDVVICTLYPFEETALRHPDLDELIEKIDIGGVSLIRAAAKNSRYVTVLTDPLDYPVLIKELVQKGIISADLRSQMALKAFSTTAYYDAVIFEGLKPFFGALAESNNDKVVLPLRKVQNLRYGENPYQKAELYKTALAESPFTQLAGKELSYNNLLDLSTLLQAANVFSSCPACTIVKHTSPCGIAIADSLADAYTRAYECDPISAFGGIVGFTRPLDLKTAELLSASFYEVIAAPSFESKALELLTQKNNLRLLQIAEKNISHRQVTLGLAGALMQDSTLPPEPELSALRWVGTPRPELWPDILIAWKAAWLTKSNAITLVRNGACVGIGGGFTNRVDAARYALSRAAGRAEGAVMASDAFFPFPDVVELAQAAGIAAIIQPGGSLRDAEVEARALDLGLSMLVGGTRTFRH